MNRGVLYVMMVIANLTFAGSAQAIMVLDQEHAPIGNFGALTVANDRSQVQTFMVGTTGYLSQIDVQVAKNTNTFENLDLSIWSTDSSGLPLEKLQSESAPASEASWSYPRQYVIFNLLTNPIFVSEGDSLAIILNSEASNDGPPYVERYLWEIGQEYSPGKAYTKIGSFYSEQDGDFHFRTYVTNAVPEPATVFLFGTGFIGALVNRRRKA